MESETSLDRLPPHDFSAEQAILACVLADPGESLLACEEAIFPSDFYDLRHRTIYEGALEMRDTDVPLNLPAVVGWHKNKGTLEGIGGIAYLSELMGSATSAAGLDYFFKSVRNKATLRKLIQTTAEFVGRAYEPGVDAEQLQAEFETAALDVGRSGTGSSIRDTKEILREWQRDFELAAQGKLPTGILSGFDNLDRKAGGMMGQELIVISGLPSSGKTTLAVNIAQRVALQGIGVGIISLETSAKKIILRVLSSMGQVKASRFLTGSASEWDLKAMINAMGRLSKNSEKIVVSDEGHTSKAKICSTMRRMYQRGCRLFVVDYLQLIQGDGEKEYERVTDASKSMKMIAKQLDSPVIVISSISREGGKRDGRPKLSDLKGSGQIDFDADKVLMLYCADPTEAIRQVECHIVKNKDGETGLVNFAFLPEEFRFEQAARAMDEEDVPKEPPHAKTPYRD